MFTRHRALKLLSALLMLIGMLLGPGQFAHAASSAASSNTSCYNISPAHSGHFLDVEGGSAQNGARIIQWYRTWNRNQVFRIFHIGNSNQVWITVEPVSKVVNYLDVSGSGAGSQVIQNTFNGSSSQQWVEETSGAGYRYRNVATGLYMDVQGASYAAGAPVVQWYGNGGLNQVFYLYETSCPA